RFTDRKAEYAVAPWFRGSRCLRYFRSDVAPAPVAAMKWIAIVPAFNEAHRIQGCGESLYRVGWEGVWVIDDGSSDLTAHIAKGAGAHVISFPRNRGKGAALMTGLTLVPQWADIVLLADADLGASACNLLPLIDAVVQGADVSIAQFRTQGGFGIAKTIATWGIWSLTGRRLTSPLSGQRALSPRARYLLKELPTGWGVEVGMTVKALWYGL